MAEVAVATAPMVTFLPTRSLSSTRLKEICLCARLIKEMIGPFMELRTSLTMMKNRSVLKHSNTSLRSLDKKFRHSP